MCHRVGTEKDGLDTKVLIIFSLLVRHKLLSMMLNVGKNKMDRFEDKLWVLQIK